jgi:hypothetical protein
MATGNSNFDTLLSTTLNAYLPKLEDNIFTARALTYWLASKDRIRKIGGGAKIVEPLIYAQNTTAGSYSGYDTISTTAQTGITAAEYPWRQFAATISINGLEEAQNSGEEQLINLLEAKIMQTEETISEKMDVMLYSDGTGNSSKDFLGLEHFIATTPTSGTVGGIDRSDSTNAFWRNYVESTTKALTMADMATAYNTVSKGNDQPDFIITSQALFEKYESLLQPQLRFTDTKTADGGFQNLLFKTAPVMFDTNNPSGTVYFLNSKYLKLVAHSSKWFDTTDFVKPTNQDARFAQILCYGNLTASNCKRLGKLANRS